MKILLTQDVRKLGKAGEIVDVANGYARNYIIPQKLGVEANKAVLSEWESKKAAEAAHKEQEEAEAKALAEYEKFWRIQDKTIRSDFDKLIEGLE